MSAWSLPVRLSEVQRGVVRLRPESDAATDRRVAEAIGVEALRDLTLDATLKPWLDGAELTVRASAVVTQTCGVSLDPFEAPLVADFTLRFVPAGSPNAPVVEGEEVALDPEGEDPPEVLEGEVIDVGAAVVEHLALEVDPFPRKPDAVFEAPNSDEVISPFAALAALKGKDEAN